MTIPALLPCDTDGHQFVVYADCCSGIPGRGNAERFAAVNAVLQRLDPQPEFILFPGDEIQGLVSDPDVLREQWRYWFEEEMAWLDRDSIPLYHTTANHTVYDPQSEAIFREVMAHLPRNGPPGQEGLSYFVRRGNLLMVFINTLWTGLGGEGWVETEWLDGTLTANADARFKLVIGHHPVFPTNGFTGDWQRQVERECGRRLWEVLVRHGVLAYFCSHMLAFDVQVHEGVLQILTAGAGTEPGMPESEYRHLVQLAIDRTGLRYQVLDTTGAARESLTWPPVVSRSVGRSASRPVGETTRQPVDDSLSTSPTFRPSASLADSPSSRLGDRLAVWHFTGTLADDGRGDPQTLLSGWNPDPGLSTIWIGLRGVDQRLSVLLSPEIGRSPHLWLGPALAESEEGESASRQVSLLGSIPVSSSSRLLVSLTDSPSRRLAVSVALHQGMGPGGILWRWDDASPWSSMTNASSWGTERLHLAGLLEHRTRSGGGG